MDLSATSGRILNRRPGHCLEIKKFFFQSERTVLFSTRWNTNGPNIPIVSEANELAQTISNWITKAQFIVNINILQRD
jgi:hypothetical protein